MKQKLRTFWRLSKAEKGLLLQYTLVILLIRAALFLLPFSYFRKGYERFSRKTRHGDPKYTLEQLVWATEITGKNFAPPGRPCLIKGLTGYYFLQRNGYDSKLVNGVWEEKGTFKAHAWIEHEDQVIIGQHTDLSQYTPIFVM